MLEIRPNCECCDRDILPSGEAYICTFECTWCPDCVDRFPNRSCPDCVDRFPNRSCPNCGGNLQLRPIRPAAALINNPASTTRVVSPDCLRK
ncbi:hypothetical protein CQ020_12265 [Arthrobacter sp. MYb23]|uniref:DUF1272 domain-containing protein n=1 Tax=unclassified Arthrobacter TaxID=235627 RepID=UPI000CFD51A0|nr:MULTISPECIES: DUF1272 domain-containing protein [unclassified Arthrobacter]PRB41240.1 hypothetical protein CQ038_14160 [Arthrobacter sp. MYb51]PRB95444.1 hypothetical protein CQ020_12265 [Arthrobacter sp. MYb23]